MQAEALLAFARIAQEEADAGRRPKIIRGGEDPVLKRIVALFNGDAESTYRSWSIRNFIDRHPFRSSVDALAARLQSTARLPPAP